MRNTLDEDKPRINSKVAARRRSRLQYRRLWIVSDREPSRSIDPDEAVVHGAALIDSVNAPIFGFNVHGMVTEELSFHYAQLSERREAEG